MMMWFFVWWPYAVWHWINPLITHAVWSGAACNLAWSTSVPAPAMLFAPVTAVFGAVAGYNAAAVSAPALCAASAYVLCDWMTGDSTASFAGGLIYGFSPYETGQVLAGHLHMSVGGAIVPLCVVLVLMRMQDEIKARTFVVAFTAALVIECLTSTELLATMTLSGIAILSIALALLPDRRRSLMRIMLLVSCSYLAAAVIVSPFLYYALLRGDMPKEPIFASSFFSAVPAGFVFPGPLMLLRLPNSGRIAANVAGNMWESAYIGVPLLSVALFWLWRNRRQRAALLMAVALCVMLLAVLGPVLQVDRRRICILPWAGIQLLPLLQHALPIRFVNYALLIIAAIFSLWLAGPAVRMRKAVTAICLVTIVPNSSFLFRISAYPTPAFFSQKMYSRYLKPGENVLVIPFGHDGPSMAWQAESKMFFRMTGGDLSVMPEEFRRWPIVNTLLTGIPVSAPAAQLGSFLAAHGVDAIVVADSQQGILRDLPKSLGLRPLDLGGVALYRLTSRTAGEDSAELPELQLIAAEGWFRMMVCAAQRFLALRGEVATLNPARASALSLLPTSRWSENQDLLLAGAAHGVTNEIWVGPGADGGIAVGMPASPAAVRGLISHYSKDIDQVAYPYPKRYAGSPAGDAAVHFLMLNLKPPALRSFSCMRVYK